MKPKLMSLLLASAFLLWSYGEKQAAAQDLLPAIKKATTDLTAADKVVVGARNNLATAKRALDIKQFNSASYNNKIVTEQQKAAKEKYDKIDPKKTQEKEDALEAYQLAQELAAQRKTALDAALKLLPQRETEAKAAEAKYATTLAEAEKVAAQIKTQVRQAESDALAKLKASKQATEKAAFAKANSDQKAAANTQILKTMTDLVAADKALQASAAALKNAADKDRPKKLVETQKATKAYATAVLVVAQHIPAFKAAQAQAVGFPVSQSLIDADKALQKANAALKQATQDVQNKVKAVETAGKRVKAGQEGVKNRVAKIRAKKDLIREQAAAKRADEAKVVADKALPPVKAETEKIQKAHAATQQTAVNALAQAPEAVKAQAVKRVAAAKAAADKAAADKAPADKALAGKTAAALKATTGLTNADKAIAAAKAVADKAAADKTAAEKVVAEKTVAFTTAANAVSAETDPAKKKTAEGVAAKATAEKAAVEKTLAGKVAAIPKASAALAAAQKAQAPAKALVAKANAEKAAAAKVVADKTVVVQKATADLAAANKADADANAAVQSAAARKALVAKAMADKEAAIKKENAALPGQTTAVQALADKAKATLDAANKVVAARVAARGGLLKVQRQRYYREASSAQTELRRLEALVAAANKELQPKVTALNKAAADLKKAKDIAAKAQKDAAAMVAMVAGATKPKEAAEKVAQEKGAIKAAAEQKVKVTVAAFTTAQQVLKAAPAAEKKTAEVLVKESTAAKAAAEQKAKEAQAVAKTAQAAFDKTLAALKAVEKKSADAAKAAKGAEVKAVALQPAVDKATAEKNAVDQKVSQAQQVVDATPTKVAFAKAAAYGGLKPIADSAWNYATARHLLVRAGFGGTPDEVAELHAMGLHRAVSKLVDFTKQPSADIAFVAHPKEQPENYEATLDNNEKTRLRNERRAKDSQQIQNMRIWWLRRMIESPRPLEEKLTLFWHGQIPAQYKDVGDSYYMYLQNQLFRNNAAGNFGTLLHGIAHDGAMLKYLNNDTNVKGKANENLAREIMELFSMGRDQGYDEIDIRQGARALTGYTYDPTTGQFRFISQRHDTEPKTIFGKTGNWNGDDFARMILETPYPAKFVARRLFMFFAHGEPSTDTVEAMASVLVLNKYELEPVLENLFLSEEFYSAKAMRTQVKGPIQLVVGLHRDLGLKDADYAYLVSAVRTMGQDLFEPPSVFGWQAGRTWVTTSRTFSRYNALAEILEKRPRAGKAGVDVIGTLLAGKTFQNHAEVVDYLVKSSCNVPLSPSKRDGLIEYLKPLPPPTEWAAKPDPAVNTRLTRLLVMLICSPEYQLS